MIKILNSIKYPSFPKLEIPPLKRRQEVSIPRYTNHLRETAVRHARDCR